MANDFPQGVTYFTNGEIRLVVHFPENKVMCRYCPFCRSESDLGRFWCRLTNNMIYNPNVPELPEHCPVEITGEITGTVPKYKKGAK